MSKYFRSSFHIWNILPFWHKCSFSLRSAFFLQWFLVLETTFFIQTSPEFHGKDGQNLYLTEIDYINTILLFTRPGTLSGNQTFLLCSVLNKPNLTCCKSSLITWPEHFQSLKVSWELTKNRKQCIFHNSNAECLPFSRLPRPSLSFINFPGKC